jgi:hypothetical protein
VVVTPADAFESRDSADVAVMRGSGTSIFTSNASSVVLIAFWLVASAVWLSTIPSRRPAIVPTLSTRVLGSVERRCPRRKTPAPLIRRKRSA